MDKLKRYECCNGRAKEVGGQRFFELFNGQLVCDVFDAKALEAEIDLIKSSNTLKKESVRRLMDINISLRAENEKLKATNSKLNVQISNLFESLKDAT